MNATKMAAASLLMAIVAGGARADELTGFWLGEAGSERERIEVGLEVRKEGGVVKLLLTQPVSNYYGVELPGPVVREGALLRNEGFSLDLRLEGESLVGFYPGPNSPATFRRVAKLPVAPPIPDLPPGPGPAWQTRLNGQIFASPAVADGSVYVGTTGGVFSALDAKTGAIRWSFSAGRPIFGAAALTADAVFFVCDNGYLFRLRRHDGHEVWRYDLGDARVSRIFGHPEVFDWDWHGPTPLVAGNMVYVGSGDGAFHAVDAESGQNKWRVAGFGKIRGAAVFHDGRVYFGSADRHVYALDSATGKELWKNDTGADIEDQPLVAGDLLVVGNRAAAGSTASTSPRASAAGKPSSGVLGSNPLPSCTAACSTSAPPTSAGSAPSTPPMARSAGAPTSTAGPSAPR